MYYNTKGEKIYLDTPHALNTNILNLYMLGETLPNPKFNSLHLINSDASENKYTFEYITKGNLIVHVDKNEHIAKEGDLLIMNTNASHYYHTDPNNPVSKLFFVCNGVYVDNMMKTFGITEHTIIRSLNFSREFANLITVSQNEPGQLLTAVSELILKIMCALNPMFNNNAGNIDSVSYPLYKQIASYIDDHAHEDISIKDVASYFSTTPITMLRMFKKHYNTTPKHYILHAKIEIAKKLLYASTLPISQISSYLSFSHPNNFTNAFISITGVSPSQYRKEHASSQ